MANLALRDDRHVGDITKAGGIDVILESLSFMENEANVQVSLRSHFVLMSCRRLTGALFLEIVGSWLLGTCCTHPSRR